MAQIMSGSRGVVVTFNGGPGSGPHPGGGMGGDLPDSELKKHSQYSKTDHDYFKSKGYSNKEIKEKWDGEKGNPPQEHAKIPNVVGGMAEFSKKMDSGRKGRSLNVNTGSKNVVVTVNGGPGSGPHPGGGGVAEARQAAVGSKTAKMAMSTSSSGGHQEAAMFHHNLSGALEKSAPVESAAHHDAGLAHESAALAKHDAVAEGGNYAARLSLKARMASRSAMQYSKNVVGGAAGPNHKD